MASAIPHSLGHLVSCVVLLDAACVALELAELDGVGVGPARLIVVKVSVVDGGHLLVHVEGLMNAHKLSLRMQARVQNSLVETTWIREMDLRLLSVDF